MKLGKNLKTKNVLNVFDSNGENSLFFPEDGENI